MTFISTEDMVKAGYAAYAEYAKGRDHRGGDLPPWEKLPPRVKGAWFAFAREIVKGVTE